jgi:AraC family transcriptional activator of pobA
LQPCVNNELIFIKSGKGKIIFEKKSFDLSPNKIFVISPNNVHRVECDCKIEYICLGFKCNYRIQEVIAASDGGTINVLSLLDLMRDEFEARNHQRKDMLNLLLNTILILASRLAGFSDEKKEIEQDNFNYIIHYLNSKSHNGIDIEETAKMSGLSYHRFRHRFKELTGISPQQYIIIQRINFAKKLLENTTYSTTSIALACGFHSVPQFITCFSKQEGNTPVKYRRQYLCKTSVKV